MLDLGPHALSVAYEIVPNTLSWQSDDGDIYKRVGGVDPGAETIE
jgi:hypothetical protein